MVQSCVWILPQFCRHWNRSYRRLQPCCTGTAWHVQNICERNRTISDSVSKVLYMRLDIAKILFPIIIVITQITYAKQLSKIKKSSVFENVTLLIIFGIFMLLMVIPNAENVVYFFFVLVTTIFIGIEYWTLEDDIRKYKKQKERNKKIWNTLCFKVWNTTHAK